MKKIISLFKRDYERTHKVFNQVVEGAEWVINGEGQATRKYDGTCCLVAGNKIYKRYDCKRGKIPPVNFIPAQDADPITGHWPGWVPITEQDKWHKEAFSGNEVNGTYELCGPKINGNPEAFTSHVLIRHGQDIILDCPRTFNGIREYLSGKNIEGIVWHHPDGRMVKIKKKDFNP